jgi:hypothetical protein
MDIERIKKMNTHQLEEHLAKQVGYSRSTMRRVHFVRETAEDESLPAEVRELAERTFARLQAGTIGAMPAYRLVKLYLREYDLDCWAPTCRSCGAEFGAVRPDARYCSGACRQRAYRQRLAG